MKFLGQRSVLVVAALICSAGFLAAGSGMSLASSGVPYNDPNAVGGIGLCDQNGQPLTHGSINTQPFVWKAVGATAGPAPYNSTGASATLYGYQPRQGVDPREWGGSQMSGAAEFTDPAHPTAAMTGLDESLAGLLGVYSPQWDGLMQLRIYLGAPNAPIYSRTYDAANIKVQGDTWSVVGTSSVSCGSGSAVSHEQILATSSAVAASLAAQTTQQPSKPTAAGGKVTTAAGPAAGATTNAAGQTVPAASGAPDSSAASDASAPASAAASDEATGNTKGGSAPTTLIWILVVVGLLGAGFVGVQWLRSRT